MRSLTFTVLLVLSAATFPQSVPPRFTMEWEAVAAHLVERLDLQPGERFLAVAHPGLFDELIPHLRYEVMKAGGVQPRENANLEVAAELTAGMAYYVQVRDNKSGLTPRDYQLVIVN